MLNTQATLTPEQEQLYQHLVSICQESPDGVYTFDFMHQACKHLQLAPDFDLLTAIEVLEHAGRVTLNNPEAGEPEQFVPWRLAIVERKEQH